MTQVLPLFTEASREGSVKLWNIRPIAGACKKTLVLSESGSGPALGIGTGPEPFEILPIVQLNMNNHRCVGLA